MYYLLLRPLLGCFGILAVCCSPAGASDALISEVTAARYGLQRAWFSQVRVDGARHHISHWLLNGDQVMGLTTDGTLHVIDATTGGTLWVNEVGFRRGSTTGAAINGDHVALLTATRLHILDRQDGRRIWSRTIGGAPSAAPALSDTYAYVAMLNGRVEGYDLADPTAFVWQFQSVGRIFQSPTATGKVVSWPTNRGYLYVGQAESPRVLFRVETGEEIVTPPAERAPYLYVASLDGYLYCFDEKDGSELWRYATGFAITSTPAIVGDQVFVASEGPTLHAVEADTGKPMWRTDGVAQFVARGAQQVYGVNSHGALIIIDPQTGDVVGRLTTESPLTGIVNDKTDRIYLVNDRGLVQCFYELGADEPTNYRMQPDEADEDASAEQPAESIEAPTPGEPVESTESPFESDEAEEEDPFGGFEEDPFGE